MKRTIASLNFIIISMACSPTKQKVEQAFKHLQIRVDSILQNKLSELNALSEQTIIMEVQIRQII